MAFRRAKPPIVTGGPHKSRARGHAIDRLREFIAALEARAPRGDRDSEVDIARDAARLKHEALERIAAIERAG